LLASTTRDYTDIMTHFVPLVSKPNWTQGELHMLTQQGLIG
jgi:hypothetical protein